MWVGAWPLQLPHRQGLYIPVCGDKNQRQRLGGSGVRRMVQTVVPLQALLLFLPWS